MMLKAIKAGALPIPPKMGCELELVRKIDLLHEVAKVGSSLRGAGSEKKA